MISSPSYPQVICPGGGGFSFDDYDGDEKVRAAPERVLPVAQDDPR
jgi:hypothetical protein